jgi:uncharacterized repeat protein (TIGR03803 family)
MHTTPRTSASALDLLRATFVAATVACASAGPSMANAQTVASPRPRPAPEAIVHDFDSQSGSNPHTGLVLAADGNFYGTTFAGAAGLGTVFKLTPDGTMSVLHSFTGIDGAQPASGLVRGGDGDLYGLTSGGGAFNGGTAYKISPGGAFTLLHDFDPATEGHDAYLGALVQGPDGSFYGVTSQGGPLGRGVAFKMTPGGDVSVLHAFSGGAGDGTSPVGGLTLASDGNFYGVTVQGGTHNAGTLYRLTPAGALSILLNFGGSTRAPAGPQAAPVQGPDGMLYGTTGTGGRFQFYGTVYRTSFDGASFTVLHSFAGGVGNTDNPNTDGWNPIGSLFLASDGNLYGVTNEGGAHQNISPFGDGVLFRVSPAGNCTVAYDFGATAQDGSAPLAGVVQRGRFLVGTTVHGGTVGDGTVFRFTVR